MCDYCGGSAAHGRCNAWDCMCIQPECAAAQNELRRTGLCYPCRHNSHGQCDLRWPLSCRCANLTCRIVSGINRFGWGGS